MSNGDFYIGYAAGQGSNKQPKVDIQSFINQGLREGSASEFNHQSWYVQRLMRSLAARNSQKQALMQALRAYEPNHPYLNEELVENAYSQALKSVDYASLKANTSSDGSSLMLVIKMGGGLTTKGDLAMEDDGVAFTEGNSPQYFEEDLKQIFDDLDPPYAERHRRDLVRVDEDRAITKKENKEKSDIEFDRLMKPAANIFA